MDVHHIRWADFENELPNRFEKWQTFDVASGAADLCDHDIVFALIGKFTYAIFNHIGDVRNHLHGFTEVIATPFL